MMPHPFIDTDVIIRFLTGDDLNKQAAATALFEQVEQGRPCFTSPLPSSKKRGSGTPISVSTFAAFSGPKPLCCLACAGNIW